MRGCGPFPARAGLVALGLTVGLFVAGDAGAQQQRNDARPTPPPWAAGPNPVEPVCATSGDGTARPKPSPTVTFESRDSKVFLVVQSRPGETVAVVTHESGALSFDRPVCLMGVDAIVTRPVN